MDSMYPHAGPRAGRPWAVLLGGLALLALGVVLARASLPEWRAGAIPPPTFFAQRCRALAAAVGWPDPGEVSPALATSNLYGTAIELRGKGGLAWLARSRTALVVEIERPLAEAGEVFTADFALDGTAYHFRREAPDLSRIFGASPERGDDERLASRLLRAGERL